MIRNWNEFDARLRDVAVIDLAVAEAAQKRQEAMLDAETAYDARTRPLLAQRGVLADDLERFYRAHRKEAESDGKRSIEVTFGRAGMRKGKPALALLKGWNWDRVLLAIKEHFRRDKDTLNLLITTKESVNKEAVKSQLDDEQRAAIGLRVKQDDEFFFETYPEKVKTAAS